MGSQAMPGTAIKAQHGCLAEMDNLGAQYAGWGAKYTGGQLLLFQCAENSAISSDQAFYL